MAIRRAIHGRTTVEALAIGLHFTSKSCGGQLSIRNENTVLRTRIFRSVERRIEGSTVIYLGEEMGRSSHNTAFGHLVAYAVENTEEDLLVAV